MEEIKQKVTIYETKCSLCGQKIRATTSDKCREQLSTHIDNECETAKTMRRWEEKGIYKPMIKLLKLDGLDAKLKKLLKGYSLDEIRNALGRLEDEE